MKFLNWLNKWKFIITIVFSILGLFFFMMGNIGMRCFLYEETIQGQTFGIAIPLMAKHYDDAYGAIKQEGPHIRHNALRLRRISRFNILSGDAFKAYADMTIRKLDRDIAYIDKMRKQQKHERYLAKIGRR